MSQSELNNQDAEAALLGLMMTNPDHAIDGLKVLVELDFYHERNKSILRDMKKLQIKNEPIDILTLMEFGHDPEYLSHLTDTTSMVQGFKHTANLVKAYSAKRQLSNACDTIKRQLSTLVSSDPQEIRALAMEQLDILVPDIAKKDPSMAAVVERTLTEMDRDLHNPSEKMKWGLRDLDYNTGGLWDSELTLLAAAPGTGKTAMALQTALHSARKGKHVTFISLEMSETQICKRFFCQLTGVNSDTIRNSVLLNQNDWALIAKAGTELSKLNLTIDSESVTIQDIYEKCRRKREKGQLDLLVIDYLQLITSSGKNESRLQEINTISRRLKLMSRDLNMPIIALSQLNREGQRTKKAPELYDLRESGSLEQDADNVIFLWNPDSEQKTSNPILNLELIIGKQRSGRTGKMSVDFHMNQMRFVGRER